MLKTIMTIWDFLKGKKTYIAAIALMIYGILNNDQARIIEALALMGLRQGMTTEARK